jgi:hypothetical protein
VESTTADKAEVRIYVTADSTNVCGLIPYYGSTTTKGLMNPELTFTSGIYLELISKFQNVAHEKGHRMYTGFIAI